ncbi:MAG: TetR/AcrR family transcriptional regulator [Rhabdochlamydiaceae bacterium]|nr:TetR/AcrR family transcriptional regulator [Rhabdochlamydiaceae bacterium]
MSNTKKRIYNSEARTEQASLTKGRILHCAKKLFQRDGFEAVTIESLAKAAEVSASTIYSLFQSKRGILKTLMDEALPDSQREALVKKVCLETPVKERLAIAAKISRQMYDAERSQMVMFQGASVLAPEFKELEEEREKRRYLRQEETIKLMIKEKSLIKGLTQTKARDILWAFTGRDMYRMFVIEQGWTPDEYENWLADLLLKMLVDPQSKQ